MLTITYLALAAIGCLYIVFAVLTGHLSDVGHGPTGPHMDPGAHGSAASYGVEGSGHGMAKAGDMGVGSFHFPFFSPLALAALFAAIGGWGLIALYGFKVTEGASLAVAVPLAMITAYGVTYTAFRIVSSSTGGSAIRVEDLVGVAAEVTTPITEGAVGEVAAIVGNQRYSAPAREVDGKPLARGAQVTVVRMAGTTLIVKAGEHS